jgi:hypothetical protein
MVLGCILAKVFQRFYSFRNVLYFIENDKSSYVVAAEWMQSIKGKDYRYCMEFGSDNSIFLSHVTFD